MKSIAEQSFTNFEHWIIDGGSTDGTLEYLESYHIHSIEFISEADKGIYDAMNKGIEKAYGDWVIFMNAGDGFVENNTMSKLSFGIDAAVLYGDSKVRYADGFERIMKADTTHSLWKGMSFTHQAVFVKREVLLDNRFDLSYSYCADFHQIFKIYTENQKFAKVDLVIAEIEAGGISDSRRYKATREVYQINKKLNPKFRIHPYFIAKIVWGFLVVKVKSILPKKLNSYLLKKKYQA